MSVYDDVAALQERMQAAETTITGLQAAVAGTNVQTLTEGADIKALPVGRYLIPNAAVSATIINKPVTNSHTATIDVIAGGDAGQKTVIFQECSKTNPSYYHIAYYSGAWGEWNAVELSTTDWADLPLSNGITAYSDDQKPRYRRIGNEVFICGVFKGATQENQTIATLPAGFRPSKKHIVASASVGQMFAKYSIGTNGEIVLNRTTVEPIIAENWHSIVCSFSL